MEPSQSQESTATATATATAAFDNNDNHITTEQVLLRIEHITCAILEMLDTDTVPILQGFASSPTHPGKSYAFGRWNQCRSFASISMVLSYCHSLLLAERTTTTREVYYFYVTHFRSQRECDAAIWNAADLLQVQRHALGLVASPRGWFCGDLQLASADSGELLLDGRTVQEFQQHGSPISSEWLTVHEKENFTVSTKNALCILVIEKEGIYKRLVEDRFFEEYPCILVTGKGFPDLATRAMVHYVHLQTHLPVRGLADCNPFGVMVLHTYQNKRGGYGVPVEWVGLRPSQVEHLVHRNEESGETLLPQLPEQVFQELTDLDEKRLEEHLLDETHAWTNETEFDANQRIQELIDMRQYKVELEALHWLGMDFCATWLAEILESHEQQLDRADDDVSEEEIAEWLRVI